MKFLVCLKCSDVFSLTYAEKNCSCGESKGRYTNGGNAEIIGNCKAIGFNNDSFIDALKKAKETNSTGIEFKAFVIGSKIYGYGSKIFKVPSRKFGKRLPSL